MARGAVQSKRGLPQAYGGTDLGPRLSLGGNGMRARPAGERDRVSERNRQVRRGSTGLVG